MSKYTKSERHEIYKEALNSSEMSSYHPYLCLALQDAGMDFCDQTTMLDVLPEFKAMTPRDLFSYEWCSFCSDSRNEDAFIKEITAVKESVLLFMIEMTKP